MTGLMIFVLLLALMATALRREIRNDGYGRRPVPRSRADDEEPRWLQLSRLAR